MLSFVCLCVRNAIIVPMGNEICLPSGWSTGIIECQCRKNEALKKSTAKFMYLMVAYRLIVFWRFCSRGLALLLIRFIINDPKGILFNS
jgi:hypothetical protein